MPLRKRKPPAPRRRAMGFDLIGMGRRLREARLEKGERQDECPGLSGSQVSNIERAQHTPSADALLKLSRWLGVRADWLLDATPPRWMHDHLTAVVGTGVELDLLAQRVAAALKESGQGNSAGALVPGPEHQELEPALPRSRHRPG